MFEYEGVVDGVEVKSGGDVLLAVWVDRVDVVENIDDGWRLSPWEDPTP